MGGWSSLRRTRRHSRSTEEIPYTRGRIVSSRSHARGLQVVYEIPRYSRKMPGSTDAFMSTHPENKRAEQKVIVARSTL